MAHQFTLEKFSGPLDLLLSLIESEKLSVSDIALSQVTEQYLRYLDALEDRRAEELADFLVVATRLLLMKSRLLLPQFGAEADDEGVTLADQLRLYKVFLDASKKVNRLWLNTDTAFFRIEPPRLPDKFTPPRNITLSTLRAVMLQLITRLTPPKPLPETHIDRTISLKEKLDFIRTLLGRVKEANFHSLLAEAKNRTEIIVSFLALLELVKEKVVAVKQGEQFGDIFITRVQS